MPGQPIGRKNYHAWLPLDPSPLAFLAAICHAPQSRILPGTQPARTAKSGADPGASGGGQPSEGQDGRAAGRLCHFTILIAEQEGSAIMTQATEESVVGQYYDPTQNQLPCGGATNLQGRIVWVVTKKEHHEMLTRINCLFPE